jgi:hypothetical protein
MAETILLSNRPLSETARDRKLLIGREDAIRSVVRGTQFGANTIVLGARGMGKTSFLHSCDAELRAQGHKTVWINGAFPETALDLLDAVAYALDLPREDYRPGVVDMMSSLAMGGRREQVGGPGTLLTAMRLLRSKFEKRGEPEGGREIVIVDEPRPDAAHGLFGRARDELWSLPLVWLVAGDKARRGDYLKPPADSFFEKVVDLEPLAPKDALAVLRTRAGKALPADVAERIVTQANGNPRRLMSLAMDTVLAGVDEATAVLERDDETSSRLRQLGEPAQRMWQALLPMGQAAANDPALLDQLGWSRVRASQILNRLEEAGLVESSSEKAPHGRPRKIYRPVATGARVGGS